jgi:hypothetical protein
MKATEGDGAVEIVLQSLDHALAEKRPMPRQQDQAGRRQRHNQDANDSKPSPTANVKSPSSPRKSLFNKS